MTLVITNTQDSAVELFTTRDIQALADTGAAFKGADVGGLPACSSGSADACNESIGRGRFTPLSIDAGQSATVTLVFGG